MRTLFQSSAPDLVWWLRSSLEGWFSWTNARSADPAKIVPGGYFPGWPEFLVYLGFNTAHLATAQSIREINLKGFPIYLAKIELVYNLMLH